jgi:hypothetical protein
MAKKKQEVKLKEPVRIRFKQLANGNQSIYLDTELHPPKNKVAMEYIKIKVRLFLIRQYH